MSGCSEVPGGVASSGAASGGAAPADAVPVDAAAVGVAADGGGAGVPGGAAQAAGRLGRRGAGRGGAGRSLRCALEGFEGPLDLLLELARGAEGGSGAHLHPVAGRAVPGGDRGGAADPAGAGGGLAGDGGLADLAEVAAAAAGRQPRRRRRETAADVLAARLRDLQAMRAAAAWLGARPRLGQDVFARGVPEDHTEIDRSRLVLDLTSLMRAYCGGAARRGRQAGLSAAAGAACGR